MKQTMIEFLEEHDFRYCESDFWNNPLYSNIERELVRFRWGKSKI